MPPAVAAAANGPGGAPITKLAGDDSGLGGLLGADDLLEGTPAVGQQGALPPVLGQLPPPPDKATIDRQAAKVESARQTLAAAQTKLDDAAGQTYTEGAGAGPGKDVTNPLSQAVFDARAELTEQTRVLNELNYASAAAGGPTAPVAPLPENADVQAFPSEPPVLERATGAFTEGMKDASKTVWDATMPDVGNMYHVATDWDDATPAERTQAALDAAGMVPLPGAKFLTEGVEHGLDALGAAARHLDDAPTPHVDVDTPAAGHGPVDAPVEHHAPEPVNSPDPVPVGEHTVADLSSAGFSHQELNIANAAQDIFTSSGMNELRHAAQNGVAEEVEINGYKILYEPGLPSSGFSLASIGERGFAIGPEGMSSEAELARTVAHELYRVNMTQIPELGVDAARAASETRAASAFAQKFGDAIIKGGG